MPDVVTLAQNITLKLPSAGNIVTQKIEESFDTSPYTDFSLQIGLIGQSPAPGAIGIDVEILTSMNRDDDDNSWKSMGSVTISGAVGLPEWKFLKIPNSGSTTAPLLFRYIRWRVTFLAGTTSATFTILGMAHR